MRPIWMLPAACLGLATGAHGQVDKLLAGQLSVETLAGVAQELWSIIGPGGKLHPAYFLEHKGHLIIEGLLVTVILFLFLQRAFKPKSQAKAVAPLTDKVRPAASRGPRAPARPRPGRHRAASQARRS
jgi:serine palmitoyltransferase